MVGSRCVAGDKLQQMRKTAAHACPCGLYYEDVREDCKANFKRCPNFYADESVNGDGTPKICNALLGAHPHDPIIAGPPSLHFVVNFLLLVALIQQSSDAQAQTTQSQQQYFKVSAIIENSRFVKGWRAKMFALADSSHGYYSEGGESASMYYQGNDLHLAILFRDVDHARDFRIALEQRCGTFHLFKCYVAENYEEVLFSSNPREIRANHYVQGDSESPAHTFSPSDYKSQPNDEEISVCSAVEGVARFQMIENPDHPILYGLGMYKCHLASQSKYPDHKSNNNNILYLSWITHQRIDGLNRATKEHMVPSLAIRFERFGDFEIFNYGNGGSFKKQLVHISLESPDMAVLDSVGILLKEGSYFQEGRWFTFVHVDNGDEFKKFLEIKYKETQALWNCNECSQSADVDEINIGDLQV